MWILPRNFASSPSSPEVEGLTSASDWQFRALERSVTWREKLSPSRLWFARWKKAPWIQHLCGRLSRPSTAERGVALWISSLAGSRVRTSAARGSAPELPGSVPDFGSTTHASSRRSAPDSSSSRTWQRLPDADSTSCSPILPRTGSMRSGAYSARPKSVRPTEERESSSWATPTAKCAEDSQTHRSGARSAELLLTGQAKMWPTATDAKASGAAGYSTESGRHSGVTLTDAACRGLLAPQTPKVGVSTSTAGLVLNPRFVEALMGWPPGWTRFDSWETAPSRIKSRSVSTSYSKGSSPCGR